MTKTFTLPRRRTKRLPFMPDAGIGQRAWVQEHGSRIGGRLYRLIGISNEYGPDPGHPEGEPLLTTTLELELVGPRL